MVHLRRLIRGKGTKRVVATTAIVLGGVLAMGSPASAAPHGHTRSAPVHRNDVSAFARFGDCAEPTVGVACHFASVVTGSHTLQIELTTIELQEDGQQLFTRDTLCNIEHAKIDISPKDGVVAYSDVVPASSCEQLVGDAPTDLSVDVVWSTGAPLADGSNDCSVTATIGTEALGSPLFCSVLVGG